MVGDVQIEGLSTFSVETLLVCIFWSLVILWYSCEGAKVVGWSLIFYL